MERKHVDGCAIFWRTGKFSLLKEHLVEFNQVRDGGRFIPSLQSIVLPERMRCIKFDISSAQIITVNKI